jgi:2'-5' RNA ligase
MVDINYNFYSQDLRESHTRYAVVVFLPQHLDEIIAPLRERYDPIYNLVASHITLVFPFESDRPLDELTGLIRAETARHEVIPVELESIGDFYPHSPIIYWRVRKNEALNELYYRLYSCLGLPLPYKQYQPHVTVAREISNHRVMLVKDKIVSYLPHERFIADKVDLITPLSGNRWVSVRTFPLAGYRSSSE